MTQSKDGAVVERGNEETYLRLKGEEDFNTGKKGVAGTTDSQKKEETKGEKGEFGLNLEKKKKGERKRESRKNEGVTAEKN